MRIPDWAVDVEPTTVLIIVGGVAILVAALAISELQYIWRRRRGRW